jgi:predicted DNA-binding transcriptional regulator YafY
MIQEAFMPARGAEEKVRISRVLMIDEAIRSGRFPKISNLAKKAEVNERTIQRDIEYLRDIYQAPVAYDYRKRGYYYSEPNFFIKSIVLTEGELFSVALFDQLLDQYRNTPLGETLRQIFNKIVRSMPDNVTVNTGLLAPQVSIVSEHQGRIDRKVFETIFTALKTRQTARFDYRPLQKTTYMRRTVDPYHAICQRGNWYFIGHCHDKNEPRMFSFSRVKKAALTGKQFSIPADFQPELIVKKLFKFKAGLSPQGALVYQVGLVAGAEAVVDVYYRNSRGAGAEHSQEGGKAAEGCPVAHAGGKGDHRG